MMSTEEMQTKQEDKDALRDNLLSELKRQWFNYAPAKRVDFIKRYPEISIVILEVIEQK